MDARRHGQDPCVDGASTRDVVRRVPNHPNPIVAKTIANGELTFDLARLREAIHQPIRKERPHGKKDVEQELDQMIPGATLVGTRGFGDAVIRHMND